MYEAPRGYGDGGENAGMRPRRDGNRRRPDGEGPADADPGRRHLRRALLASALLVVVYFLLPVEADVTGARVVARTVLAAAGVVVAAMLVGRLVIRLRWGGTGTVAAALLVALVGGVVTFALVDYLVAVAWPGEFADLRTRVDALYFAVTTLTTTGFGDVHAQGQLARALVTVQMVYNVAVLATGGSTLVNRIIAQRRRVPPPPG